MKKLGIFFISLLTLGAVSCEDTSDRGIPQVNEQQAIMSANGLTVEFGENLAENNALNLADWQEKTISVIDIVSVENLPENGVVSFKMHVSGTADFAREEILDVTDGTVSGVEWDKAFRSIFGNAPYEQQNYIRFAAYVNVNGQLSRLGGFDTWYAAKTVNVTPIDLGIEIEDSYYLIGSINGGDVATAVKLNHSDASPYDDPVFSILLDLAPADVASGWKWQIIPESTFKLGYVPETSGSIFGPAGSTSALNGDLAASVLEDGIYTAASTGKIYDSGQFLLTVDMINLTFDISSAVEMLYTPGDSNGWSQGSSQVLTTGDYANYSGFAYLAGGYKFTTAPDWDHVNLGASGAEGKLSNDSGAGNLMADPAGLYWCTVNLPALTYENTLVTTMGMIGDFNAWAGDIVMTPSADFLTWTGELTVADAGGFKFRVNEDWNINLGGDYTDNLTPNGNNIMIEPGTYTVTLDLSKVPYSCTIVKK